MGSSQSRSRNISITDTNNQGIGEIYCNKIIANNCIAIPIIAKFLYCNILQ